MELSLNRIESISSKNTLVEKKGIELTLIVNNTRKKTALFNCEDMCDGDVWEWNLIYGIGNDVY